jgi:hypothetical protein
VPEELEVLWSVFDLFPELSLYGWKRNVSMSFQLCPLIDFTENTPIPLKIYLHGMGRIVSIPQDLNGLVVSGWKRKEEKKLKMEIKHEMRFSKIRL